MSRTGSDAARRAIATSDPAEEARLEHAWAALEDVLDSGDTAAQLDVDQLDRIICDLVAIRHRKLVGAEPSDSFMTVVTERRDESMVMESYFEDEFGNRFSPMEEP